MHFMRVNALSWQFNTFHKKVDAPSRKYDAIFWQDDNLSETVYLLSRQGSHRPNSPELYCRLPNPKSNRPRQLPLARLREREGPAAKRWEGEGGTLHKAALAVGIKVTDDVDCEDLLCCAQAHFAAVPVGAPHAVKSVEVSLQASQACSHF